MITIPSSNKRWTTSFKGEDLGNITNSFGVDLFSSPGRVKAGGKFYPHTIGTLSGSALTPVFDFITASISDGATRPTKTWGVAGNKLIVRASGTSPFVKDTATGFTSAETTGTMSDFFKYADGTGNPLEVTEVALPQGSGAFAITGDGNNTKWAQSFTQVQGPFKQLTVYLKKTGSPTDNLLIQIQSDNAGVPSGTTLSQYTIAAEGLTTSFVLKDLESADWTVPSLQFSLDSVYHIVFSRSGSADTSNYVSARLIYADKDITDTANTADPYKNGQLQQYNGSTWTRTITYTKTDTFTANGTWTVPSGISSATVECWAAGGSGIAATGGGGGGAYSRSVINVTAGEKHGILVGQESLYRTDGLSSAFNGVQILAVGGGGAGGRDGASNTRPGGGGGGGGVVEKVLGLGVASYSVTVGNGGASSGANGANTTFGSLITATGGGGGGSSAGNGSNGGSGGGSSQATATEGTGIPGQGHDGGDGFSTNAAGGGGGAAAAGNIATNNTGGNGGAGRASSISGTLQYYGGGGGGGAFTTAGTGGVGGGGNGALPNNNGVAGTANTGGGGGGSGTNGTVGAAGGSGIVIVRYRTAAYTATGGTVTTDGDYTVHTFTTNGTFQITAVNYSRVLAVGGKNGYNGGTGGLATDGIGDVKYDGGDGALGATDCGGGGGAGDSGAGVDTGGDIGGNGGQRQGGSGGGDFNGTYAFGGNLYGGGGNSRASTTTDGARGEVRITYEVTATANYANVSGRSFGRQTSSLSHPVVPPSKTLPGDLLIAIVSADNQVSITMSGWTLLGQSNDLSNDSTQAVFWKRATGDDYTIARTSISTGTTYVCYDIINADTPTAIQGTSTDDPPKLTMPESGKYLWISAYTATDPLSNGPTAPPSGYGSFIIQTEDYPYDAQGLLAARTAVAEKQSEAISEDPGAYTDADNIAVYATIAVPYKAQNSWLDASMSIQVEFPAAAERLYVTTSKDVKFLNVENGIWQSLWMGVFQRDALDSNYPHPVAYVSAGGLVFVGDGNVVHNFIANGVSQSESTLNKLVFDETHFVAWMGVTKSAIFIGLNAKESETLPGYVVYYEPTSESTRIFEIKEGHTVGWIKDDNCFILDKSGQLRYYSGVSFPVFDYFPPYFQQLKIDKLPHRNGIIAKDNQVMFLWEGQYPWGAGVWVYEDNRLYHKHPLIFDPTTLNSYGSYDVPTGWGALYDISDYTFAGASLYGTDNATETKGIFANFKTSGVTVSDSKRGFIRGPRFGSSQRDNIWQRVFAKIDYRPAGLVDGSVVLKYRQEAPDIGEGVYASSFAGTWTSSTTFTTTDATFKTAVDNGYIAAGNEVIIRRGQSAGLRSKIVSITGTTTRTVTIAEGLAAVTSGSMNFSVENWRIIPNKDLVGKPSEWLQVQSEIREKVELEELQVTFDNNETNVE